MQVILLGLAALAGGGAALSPADATRAASRLASRGLASLRQGASAKAVALQSNTPNCDPLSAEFCLTTAAVTYATCLSDALTASAADVAALAAAQCTCYEAFYDGCLKPCFEQSLPGGVDLSAYDAQCGLCAAVEGSTISCGFGDGDAATTGESPAEGCKVDDILNLDKGHIVAADADDANCKAGATAPDGTTCSFNADGKLCGTNTCSGTVWQHTKQSEAFCEEHEHEHEHEHEELPSGGEITMKYWASADCSGEPMLTNVEKLNEDDEDDCPECEIHIDKPSCCQSRDEDAAGCPAKDPAVYDRTEWGCSGAVPTITLGQFTDSTCTAPAASSKAVTLQVESPNCDLTAGCLVTDATTYATCMITAAADVAAQCACWQTFYDGCLKPCFETDATGADLTAFAAQCGVCAETNSAINCGFGDGSGDGDAAGDGDGDAAGDGDGDASGPKMPKTAIKLDGTCVAVEGGSLSMKLSTEVLDVLARALSCQSGPAKKVTRAAVSTFEVVYTGLTEADVTESFIVAFTNALAEFYRHDLGISMAMAAWFTVKTIAAPAPSEPSQPSEPSEPASPSPSGSGATCSDPTCSVEAITAWGTCAATNAAAGAEAICPCLDTLLSCIIPCASEIAGFNPTVYNGLCDLYGCSSLDCSFGATSSKALQLQTSSEATLEVTVIIPAGTEGIDQTQADEAANKLGDALVSEEVIDAGQTATGSQTFGSSSTPKQTSAPAGSAASLMSVSWALLSGMLALFMVWAH